MLQPLEEVRLHFEINVVGLVSVTQAFLPLLGATKDRAHPPGRILNVSSVGGRIASPFIGARPRTRYAIVPGRFANWTIPASMPDRLLDRIIGQRAGLT